MKEKKQTLVKRVNMIAPVKMCNYRFHVQLTFRVFDWLLTEKIVANEVNIEKLDRKPLLWLALGIYPQ